jgi:F0F1-type ATP synthase delta subunit
MHVCMYVSHRAVNEAIVGGLQIKIDDRFLDLSVATRVNDLSHSLETAEH